MLCTLSRVQLSLYLRVMAHKFLDTTDILGNKDTVNSLLFLLTHLLTCFLAYFVLHCLKF